MRRKDWADYRAEDLFELVRNAVDDDIVVNDIAESLRLAFAAGAKGDDEPDFDPLW